MNRSITEVPQRQSMVRIRRLGRWKEAVIKLGSTACALFHTAGILDAPIDACSDPRDMLVFGGLMIVLGEIVALMLLVLGRGIKPT